MKTSPRDRWALPGWRLQENGDSPHKTRTWERTEPGQGRLLIYLFSPHHLLGPDRYEVNLDRSPSRDPRWAGLAYDELAEWFFATEDAAFAKVCWVAAHADDFLMEESL